MENETLKQLVLAKGREVAPSVANTIVVRGQVSITTWPSGVQTIDRIPEGHAPIPICILDSKIADDHDTWWIAAKILDIPTEMSIDEFEQDLTNRQYIHDLRQAFDAGGDWGFAKANGAKIHSDVAFNQFKEKEPTAPAPEPVPFFDSQLRELCVALGWQGGTYHQVLAEIKRLKAYETDNREPSHC